MPSRVVCSSRRSPLRKPCPPAALASAPLAPTCASAPGWSMATYWGYGAPGGESHEVRGSELALYHPRVVSCHVPTSVPWRHAAPAVGHVDRVAFGEAGEAEAVG